MNRLSLTGRAYFTVPAILEDDIKYPLVFIVFDITTGKYSKTLQANSAKLFKLAFGVCKFSIKEIMEYSYDYESV